MHLVQILLPVKDDKAAVFPAALYERLIAKLTTKFGGVTSFMRAPAEGRWHQNDEIEYDEIVVVEVMVDVIEVEWWASLRRKLEEDFEQDEIVIRAQKMVRI